MIIAVVFSVFPLAFFLVFGLLTAPTLPVSRETLSPVDPSWPPPAGPRYPEESTKFEDIINLWSDYLDYLISDFIIEPIGRYSFNA